MGDNVMKKIKVFLGGAAAAVPYAGNAYTHYLSQKSNAELKDILHTLHSLSQDELSQLETTSGQIQAIREQLSTLINTQSSLQKLTVVIPAGGEGGSLFPVTRVMPKCLVSIGAKSMLQHIVDPFYRNPDLFEKVIVMTDQYHEAIDENIRQGGYDGFVQCQKVSGESLPDALMKLEPQLASGAFLIHFNDVIIEKCDWEHVYGRYFENKERKGHIGMLLCSSFYPHPLGIGVIKEGAPDMLESFIEKPKKLVGGNLANLAVGIFEPEIFTYMNSQQTGLFQETLVEILQAKRVISLYKIEKWHHVQDLKTLFYLQNEADLSFLQNRFRQESP